MTDEEINHLTGGAQSAYDNWERRAAEADRRFARRCRALGVFGAVMAAAGLLRWLLT